MKEKEKEQKLTFRRGDSISTTSASVLTGRSLAGVAKRLDSVLPSTDPPPTLEIVLLLGAVEGPAWVSRCVLDWEGS